MSTNYYVRTADTPADSEGIHLGKHAQGHPFMFRGHPDLGVTDYTSWYQLAESGQIITEAGMPVTLDELVNTVDGDRNQWRFARHTPHRDQVDDENGNRFTLVEFS